MVGKNIVSFVADSLVLYRLGGDYRGLVTDYQASGGNGAADGWNGEPYYDVSLGGVTAVGSGGAYSTGLFEWVLPGEVHVRANRDCTRFLLDYHYYDYDDMLGGDGAVTVGPFTVHRLITWLDGLVDRITVKRGMRLDDPSMRGAARRVENFVDFRFTRNIETGAVGSMMSDALVILGLVAYGAHPNVPYNVAMTDLTDDLLTGSLALSTIVEWNHPVPIRPELVDRRTGAPVHSGTIVDADPRDYYWNLHTREYQ